MHNYFPVPVYITVSTSERRAQEGSVMFRFFFSTCKRQELGKISDDHLPPTYLLIGYRGFSVPDEPTSPGLYMT